MRTLLKRYQFFGKSGIEWTDWFKTSAKQQEEWQVHNKLKNEYKAL